MAVHNYNQLGKVVLLFGSSMVLGDTATCEIVKGETVSARRVQLLQQADV